MADNGVTGAKRYSSFVVRNGQPGGKGIVEIAHEQSGERIRATSLNEAIGWMRSRPGTVSGVGAVASGSRPTWRCQR